MVSFVPKGIIPAIVTPLTRDGRINESSLRKLVNYLLDGGSHGLFVMGTSGEFYGFTLEEKKAVLQITLDEVRGRVPVIMGTGAISTRESILLTHMAEECGADAVSVLTPMFISPSQEELYQHYRTIAESTRLPVILYNNLPKTGVTIAPATVERLAEIPNIAGIKDSSGDFTNTTEYIRRTRDKNFSVLAGRDTHIYAALCCGAVGSIASCANVAPRLCADIYDKFVAGDRQGALEAQEALVPLRLAFSLGSFPSVVKEALAMIGIDVGPCVSPISGLAPEKREELRKILTGMGLL